MDGTIVALYQHLSYAGSTAKVAINLERRMGIEEVGIGAAIGIGARLAIIGKKTEHVGDNLEGVVTIEHTRPEIDLPSQAPTCCHVTTLIQGISCSSEEVGVSVGGHLVGGIESVEMRDMTMLILGIVGILKSLLQLSMTTYLHGRKSVDGLTQALLIGGILAEYLSSMEGVAQRIKDNLVVHRTAGSH